MIDQKGIEENYRNLEYQNVFIPPNQSKTTKMQTTASTICSELQHYQSVKTLKDFDDLQGSRKSIKIDENPDECSLATNNKGRSYQRRQTKVSLESVEE